MLILEMHCIPFIERTGFGLGLLGEQGGEQLHAALAPMERRTAGMRHKSQQLKSTLEAHRLNNSSELRSVLPNIKRRKKDKVD